MVQRDKLRNEINEFCMENVFNSSHKYTAFGSAPMAVVVYLGKKTVDELEEQMKGAFDSLLSIRPEIHSVYLSNDNIESDSYFKSQLTEVFGKFNEQGLLVTGKSLNIQISFIAMMDDPILREKCALDGVRRLKAQLDEIRSLNVVQFGKVSFFGIFNQKAGKNDYDYSAAFRFINEGSVNKYSLWDTVYHLQRYFFENSYEPYTRTIAMQILRDAIYQSRRTSRKTDDPDDYCWYYLGMDEMKLPELLICNILIMAYETQMEEGKLNEYERQCFKKALEKILLEEILSSCEILNTSDWVRYLPMNIQYETRQEERGSWGRSQRKIYQAVDYSQMLVDQELLDVVLTECTEDTVAELQDSNRFLKVVKKSLQSLTRTDMVDLRWSKTISSVIGELKANFEKRLNLINLEVSSETEESYFQQLYDSYTDKEKLEIAIRVLDTCLHNSAFDTGLTQMLKGINSDCAETKRILEELRVNSFGGTALLKLPDFNHDLQISVDTPVREACKHIDQDILNLLVNDDTILSNNAAAFFTKVLERSTMRNGIGHVSGNHNNSSLSYEVFVEKPIDAQRMIVHNDSRFRANTMQVLSYCEWSSVENLFAYYRGE